MIESMKGDFTGVVGLPVFLLGQLLEKAGMVVGRQ
jgi:predicted house-cleaning NTP pyrophosphatase (Maf/HAM1 superfamily)